MIYFIFFTKGRYGSRQSYGLDSRLSNPNNFDDITSNLLYFWGPMHDHLLQIFPSRRENAKPISRRKTMLIHKTFNLYCTHYILEKYNPKLYLFTNYVYRSPYLFVLICKKMEIYYGPTCHRYRQFKNPSLFQKLLSGK